jgi:enoyl-CoA hydratase/carnithine racemase
MALHVQKCKEIMMLQRFILAPECERLGLVNRVVPVAQLDHELQRTARALCAADPFHLRMMKLTVNQAQDAAGFTTSLRGGLSNWMAWRWHFESQGNVSGDSAVGAANSKRLAPVAQALAEPLMYFSRLSSRL